MVLRVTLLVTVFGAFWAHATADDVHKAIDLSNIPVTEVFEMFMPQTKLALRKAVDACLKWNPEGDCEKYPPRGAMRNWDISRVADMSNMFSSRIFISVAEFNADISEWDVSHVESMYGTFAFASAFNQDLSLWSVSSVTTMFGMFRAASVFNRDLSRWDVSRVTDMNIMFFSARMFNSDVSDWDVSNVGNMYGMFWDARAFNGDVSDWDVAKVRNMGNMFRDATSFNIDISTWDISDVRDMYGMFMGATAFQQILCAPAWDQIKTNKYILFERSPGSISKATKCTGRNGYLPQSREDLKKAMKACFKRYPKGNCDAGPHGPIGDWDVSRITDMNRIFSAQLWNSASVFNGDISRWNVSSVTSMYGAFWEATAFNGDLSKWNVSNVTDMDYMFYYAVKFNGDISRWDVSRVQGMYGMFWGASSFDDDISEWDVSSVRSMANMFEGAGTFNSDISEWNVSNVKDMFGMFKAAASFKGDISKWDVSSAASMSAMFASAMKFNGDISKWDVSRVTDMSGMFIYASSFNGDISEWDVSSVDDMSNMFWAATKFNVDLSYWDVSNVTKMDSMFQAASSYRRILCGDAWIASKASKTQMFAQSPGSLAHTPCKRELKSPLNTPIPASASTPAIASACTKCGTFKKSGRVSCCAPGGAWYNNCGGVGDRTVDHRWLEGVEVCKPATLIIDLACPKCGIIGKSGKLSCCGRGGSWFGNCGSAGEAKLDHKWSEGVEACKAWSQPEIVVGQQLHGAQDESNDSSNDTARVNSNAPASMAPDTFMLTPFKMPNSTSDSTSTSTLAKSSIITVASTLTTADSSDSSTSAPDPASLTPSIAVQRYGSPWNTTYVIVVFVILVFNHN